MLGLAKQRRHELHERMLHYYETAAAYYDHVQQIAGARPSDEEQTLFDALVANASFARGTVRLLELGCGRGESTPALLQQLGGGTLHGIDASPAAIAEARAQYPLYDFRVGDIQRLPYEDSCFDVVVLNYVLEHTCEPDRVIDEALRVLRKSGLIGMIVPVSDLIWMMPPSLRHRQQDRLFLMRFAMSRWIHFLRLRYERSYFAFPLVEHPIALSNDPRDFMPDDDQVYLGSTLELTKFLQARGCCVAFSAGRDLKTFIRNGRRPWVDQIRSASFAAMRMSLGMRNLADFTTTRTLVARKTT